MDFTADNFVVLTGLVHSLESCGSCIDWGWACAAQTTLAAGGEVSVDNRIGICLSLHSESCHILLQLVNLGFDSIVVVILSGQMVGGGPVGRHPMAISANVLRWVAAARL